MKNKTIMSICVLFVLGFFIITFLTMCEVKKENKTIDEMLMAEVDIATEKTNIITTIVTSTTKLESYTTKKIDTKEKKISTNNNINKTSINTLKTLATATTKTITTNNNIYYSNQDIIDIAKVLYAECGGVPSKTEQACVAWTVLNRVDKYNSSVYSVVRAKYQFAFYENGYYNNDSISLAKDVLTRWNKEKQGMKDVGRVLPPEYLYFYGDGIHNYFYTQSGKYWDYSLPSPYNN